MVTLCPIAVITIRIVNKIYPVVMHKYVIHNNSPSYCLFSYEDHSVFVSPDKINI